jgi:hypothetical protein
MVHRLTYFSLLLAITAAFAGADAGDPPSRVARLNLIEGSVSFRPGSVEDWTAASLNYPLTTGDHLWADDNARAELHVGSTAIRISSRTALAVLNLDDNTVQLSLTEGSLNIRLRDLAEGEVFEVDTPNVAISFTQPGDYRIDADSDASRTNVVVRAGEAEVNGGGSAFSVRPTESASMTGMDTVSQEVSAAPGIDEFEQWAMDRDRAEDESVSARYVPRDMTGYEDLDRNGVWQEEQQYGWVWAPRSVPVGWAPYRDGHWAWVEPWGWTWIDDEPWGFAPFHYGRWAYVGAGWVWVPGRRVVGVRSVYAPALVAFVGGPRFGVSIAAGGGGVAAWFPLGPGEVYRPAYRVSETYVRNVNVVHVTNIAVIRDGPAGYRNRDIAGAVTVVSHDTFVSARPVWRSTIAVPRESIMRGEVVGSTAPIPPTRVSVMARGDMVVRRPPERFVERQVVVRHAPPAPPVSFASKEQVLRGNAGRPLDASQMNSVRGTAPPPRSMVRTVAPADGRRFGNGSAPSFNRPPNNDRPTAQPAGPRTDRPATVDRPFRPQPRSETPRAEAPRPPAERPANADHPREQKRNDRPQQRHEERKKERPPEKQ